MSCAAVIVAAGQGTRMGFDKLLAPLAGKPVLQHSLDAFLQVEGITSIVVVTDEHRFDALRIPAGRTVLRVGGGAERHLSVLAGVQAAPDEVNHVAVHDGARALIHPEAIAACLDEARRTGAAALARRITETLKKADPDGRTREAVPRDYLWATETPQIFALDLLRRAYEEVLERDLTVTDEVSALETINHPTQLVEDPFPNPKITVPADLMLAEALLRDRLG